MSFSSCVRASSCTAVSYFVFKAASSLSSPLADFLFLAFSCASASAALRVFSCSLKVADKLFFSAITACRSFFNCWFSVASSLLLLSLCLSSSILICSKLFWSISVEIFSPCWVLVVWLAVKSAFSFSFSVFKAFNSAERSGWLSRATMAALVFLSASWFSVSLASSALLFSVALPRSAISAAILFSYCWVFSLLCCAWAKAVFVSASLFSSCLLLAMFLLSSLVSAVNWSSYCCTASVCLRVSSARVLSVWA